MSIFTVQNANDLLCVDFSEFESIELYMLDKVSRTSTKETFDTNWKHELTRAQEYFGLEDEFSAFDTLAHIMLNNLPESIKKHLTRDREKLIKYGIFPYPAAYLYFRNWIADNQNNPLFIAAKETYSKKVSE